MPFFQSHAFILWYRLKSFNWFKAVFWLKFGTYVNNYFLAFKIKDFITISDGWYPPKVLLLGKFQPFSINTRSSKSEKFRVFKRKKWGLIHHKNAKHSFKISSQRTWGTTWKYRHKRQTLFICNNFWSTKRKNFSFSRQNRGNFPRIIFWQGKRLKLQFFL